ncbi:hypothetical protein, partial [Rhodococcus erythropolis]
GRPSLPALDRRLLETHSSTGIDNISRLTRPFVRGVVYGDDFDMHSSGQHVRGVVSAIGLPQVHSAIGFDLEGNVVGPAVCIQFVKCVSAGREAVEGNHRAWLQIRWPIMLPRYRMRHRDFGVDQMASTCFRLR